MQRDPDKKKAREKLSRQNFSHRPRAKKKRLRTRSPLSDTSPSIKRDHSRARREYENHLAPRNLTTFSELARAPGDKLMKHGKRACLRTDEG